MTATLTPPPVTVVDAVASARLLRSRRRRRVVVLLAAVIGVALALALMVGDTFHPPAEVIAVLLGGDGPGAFAVGELRLPRAVLGVVVGACFGLAGVTFQTMLRNPLASPDIIGISGGASAAAVIGIVVLGLSGPAVSLLAIVSGLGVALAIHLLAHRPGGAGARLILIGIGVAAMLDSTISWVLGEAGQWDLQAALRWLTGSLNGATWEQVGPAAVALALLGPLLLALTRRLAALQLGDDTAAALGVPVERTRLLVIVGAVGLVAFGTAAAGPIAFVAFLSGPIASRLVGPNGSLLLPAALVGSALVVVADLVGQHALGTRFPVGVVTGVLGAPYLIHLIVRTNKAGGTL